MDQEKKRAEPFLTETDLSNSGVLGESRDKDLRKVPPAPKKKVTKMYVMSVITFIKMYGGLKCPKIHDFETLLSMNCLIEWKDVPANSTTIYVSHEWCGKDHADPSGTQIRHLSQVLKRLRLGEIDRVETEPSHVSRYIISHILLHSLAYVHNKHTHTSGTERIVRQMLKNGYVYFQCHTYGLIGFV